MNAWTSAIFFNLNIYIDEAFNLIIGAVDEYFCNDRIQLIA